MIKETPTLTVNRLPPERCQGYSKTAETTEDRKVLPPMQSLDIVTITVSQTLSLFCMQKNDPNDERLEHSCPSDSPACIAHNQLQTYNFTASVNMPSNVVLGWSSRRCCVLHVEQGRLGGFTLVACHRSLPQRAYEQTGCLAQGRSCLSEWIP